jgi:acetyltransferase EpsM
LPKVLIWGAAGHARVVADIIQLSTEYELAGFLDDTRSAPSRFLDLPVYRDILALPATLNSAVTNVIIAVGDCAARMRLAELAIANGFRLISAFHPRAVIAGDSSIGAGTVIAAGAVVNPGCVLGENVIVNTGATIDHDCRLGDGVHVSPGVHIGGGARVGSGTWLGIGSVVKDKVAIGAGVIIGAGSVVLKDIPDGVVAWGIPAVSMKPAL